MQRSSGHLQDLAQIFQNVILQMTISINIPKAPKNDCKDAKERQERHFESREATSDEQGLMGNY